MKSFAVFFSNLDDSTHSGVISFHSLALADDLKDILNIYAKHRKSLVLLKNNTNAAADMLEEEYNTITQLIMDDAYGARLVARHLWEQQSRFPVLTLTMVHQPMKEEGAWAVKKLINLIFGGTGQNEFIKPHLIVRQSSGNMGNEYIIR